MNEKQLNVTFAALADPTRRAIMARLTEGDLDVGDIAKPLAMSLPAVSKHLKVLENAGLIERGKRAQWRPCRLSPEPLKEANDWILQYKRFWEASFDRLDAYLEDIQKGDDDGRVN